MTETGDLGFETLRRDMVALIKLYVRAIADELGKAALAERVLAVMEKVPRHEFVPVELRGLAYADSPLPIGYGKTISQPFIVALMTDLLEVGSSDRVLEIGTGLGYQAALLAEIAAEVYTVEILEELAVEAAQRLRRFGYRNIEARLGDGSQGWLERAPFDRIIVTAAPELIPVALLNQLKPSGRMVIPTGLENDQKLMLVEKDPTGRLATHEIIPVRFTPLVLSH